MQISEAQSPQQRSRLAFLELGFRPFFLGAGVLAIATIILWAGIYFFELSLPISLINPVQWHAHEMIYGYALAVISGFLLTAVKNWTGIPTLSGAGLLLLFLLWVAARICFVMFDSFIILTAVFETLFSIVLLIAVSRPVIAVKQWKQMAIVSKLFLILVFNGFFYCGVFGWMDRGLDWGIYGGLYLVLGLILTMGRRVIPSFIESGVDDSVSLFNSKWLDISSMLLFLGFFVCEVFLNYPALSAWLAFLLFIVNAVRLIGWHTAGIWRKSLLWSIYLSFWFITLGFLLFAVADWSGISKYLAIHAFAYGGIGLMTIGMMSRVALGHTGRKVSEPPAVAAIVFALLIAGALVRVILPIISIVNYDIWIGLSQLLWVIAFAIFVVTYMPILIKPRLG